MTNNTNRKETCKYKLSVNEDCAAINKLMDIDCTKSTVKNAFMREHVKKRSAL
jgi:hypothetical protein